MENLHNLHNYIFREVQNEIRNEKKDSQIKSIKFLANAIHNFTLSEIDECDTNLINTLRKQLQAVHEVGILIDEINHKGEL